MSGEYLRKARQFGDPAKGYDRAELRVLCQAIRNNVATFTSRGTTFGTSHVIRLVSVPKSAGKRAQLQSLTLAGGWSIDELDAEIRRRFGRRRQGGRRRREVTDRRGLLVQAELVTRSWLRRFDQVNEQESTKRGKSTLLDRLPEPLRKAIQTAARALAEIRDAVGEELD